MGTPMFFKKMNYSRGFPAASAIFRPNKPWGGGGGDGGGTGGGTGGGGGMVGTPEASPLLKRC